MKCEELEQKKAHELLYAWVNDLKHATEFSEAFQDEAVRRNRNEDIWTLPRGERVYYTVTLDDRDSPYLLLGINSKFLNISSVAKVVNDEERMGTCCLKFFIESILLAELRKADPTRDRVCAIPSTTAGKNLFERLRDNPPKGVTGVTVSDTYPYNVTIEYNPETL